MVFLFWGYGSWGRGNTRVIIWPESTHSHRYGYGNIHIISQLYNQYLLIVSKQFEILRCIKTMHTHTSITSLISLRCSFYRAVKIPRGPANSMFFFLSKSFNGQLVVWIPGIPLWKGLLLSSIPRNPNHQFTISWTRMVPSHWWIARPFWIGWASVLPTSKTRWWFLPSNEFWGGAGGGCLLGLWNKQLEMAGTGVMKQEMSHKFHNSDAFKDFSY